LECAAKGEPTLAKLTLEQPVSFALSTLDAEACGLEAGKSIIRTALKAIAESDAESLMHTCLVIIFSSLVKTAAVCSASQEI
jgi:hypothetical protein